MWPIYKSNSILMMILLKNVILWYLTLHRNIMNCYLEYFISSINLPYNHLFIVIYYSIYKLNHKRIISLYIQNIKNVLNWNLLLCIAHNYF